MISRQLYLVAISLSLLVAPATMASPILEDAAPYFGPPYQNIDDAFSLDFDPLIQNQLGTNTSTDIPHAEVYGDGIIQGTDEFVDYYQFFAVAGSLIILDIDCATAIAPGCDTNYVGAWNTAITLWDPLDPIADLTNFTSSPFDPTRDFGSLIAADAFLQFNATVTGFYTVGVYHGDIGIPCQFLIAPDCGTGAQGPVGSYILNVSVEGHDVRDTTPSIPEPTTLALLSLGLVGLGFTRRRMKA